MERIVVCVNALAGIEDPSAFVSDMLECRTTLDGKSTKYIVDLAMRIDKYQKDSAK